MPLDDFVRPPCTSEEIHGPGFPRRESGHDAEASTQPVP